MTSRKAQFSTYLKPIIVIIFVILLIMIVQQVLTFQVSSEQQEQEVTFAQNVPKTFQQIANCLQSDRTQGNRYLLSSDALDDYDNVYDGREPPCAEDFQYGYNVTVTPQPILLKSNDIDNEPAEFPFPPGYLSGDIALVLDRSASMSGHKLATAKEAANRFVASNINTNRIALVSFSDEATNDQEFTTDGSLLYPKITSLEAEGRTDIASGIDEAGGLDWDDSSANHMVFLTDGGDTSQAIQQIAQEVRDDGITVHGIMYGNDADPETMEQITGAECIQDDIENSPSNTCWWWEIEPVNRSRSEVLDGLRNYYPNDLVDTISNAEYTFGERNSSTGQSLRESITLNYPISIRYAPDLVLPATLNIEFRDGDLEFLVGFLNKVIKQASSREDDTFSARFEYINSQEICSTGNKICLAGTGNACVELRSGGIEPFHLQPGQYTLTANYSRSSNTVYVNGGQEGGCNR